MRRVRYAASQSFIGIVALLSRVFNALLFGGSAHQSISARAYVESHRKPIWGQRRKWIDRAFSLFEADHCFNAWIQEVERARKTLRLNSTIEEL